MKHNFHLPNLAHMSSMIVPSEKKQCFVEYKFIEELEHRYLDLYNDIPDDDDDEEDDDDVDSDCKKILGVLSLLENKYGKEWKEFIETNNLHDVAEWNFMDHENVCAFEEIICDFLDDEDRWRELQCKEKIDEALNEFKKMIN